VGFVIVYILAKWKNRSTQYWFGWSVLVSPVLCAIYLLFAEKKLVYSYKGLPALDNESYVIYLTDQYQIKRVETIDKFICFGKTFESAFDALSYAKKVDIGEQAFSINSLEFDALKDIDRLNTINWSDLLFKFGLTVISISILYFLYGVFYLDKKVEVQKNNFRVNSEVNLSDVGIKFLHYSAVEGGLSNAYEDVPKPRCEDIPLSLKSICGNSYVMNSMWFSRRLIIWAVENATKIEVDHVNDFPYCEKNSCSSFKSIGEYFYYSLDLSGYGYWLKDPRFNKELNTKPDSENKVSKDQGKEKSAGMYISGNSPALSQKNSPIASGPSASYGGRIRARIKPNIAFDASSMTDNSSAEVKVSCAPDGTIIGRVLVKSSGNDAWDNAVLKSIDKTEILPRDVDERVYCPLLLVFRPHD